MSGPVALALTLGLVLANALFVAAEFAIVAVRGAELEERAAAGVARARLVLAARERLSFVLSAAQFGITASSLLLGFVAEQAIGDSILRPAAEALGLPAEAGSVAIIVAAILVSTILQMIVGELAPKNLAIARPLAVSLAVAVPMRAFETVFGPIIRIFDSAAQWTSRVLFRLDADDEASEALTADELARIIDVSSEGGSLTAEQADLLGRALRLRATRVREVMVPWPDVWSLREDATADDLRALAARTGHSRFPVVRIEDSEVVGTVHLKDLLGHADGGPEASIMGLVTATTEVPEWATVQQLLALLRRERRTFALVIDEFGDVAGLATVEDVLEELVGDIADEFDRPRPQMRRREDGSIVATGACPIARLASVLEAPVPEGDFVTVAGFVLDELGHVPDIGETADLAGHELEVIAVEGPRIRRVIVRPRPADSPSEDT